VQSVTTAATIKLMYEQIKKFIDGAGHVLIVQAENPDGDSLGSSLALEAILSEMGKKVTMFCAVEMPKYLRYARGWDRVQQELPKDFDASIIVDTSTMTLLEKTLTPENLAQITRYPVIVLDHHAATSGLEFEHVMINDPKAVATGELIFTIATELQWPLPVDACEHLTMSIMADSLGLTTKATTANSIRAVADLVEKGANLSDLDNRRRELDKKPPEILAYKGQLLQRIEYFLDGALALIHIPWSEIEEYSDQYNPPELVLFEMRQVTGVRIAIALKTYPDGKITGKIRANPDAGIGEAVAGYFGGGGHPHAAGFKVYNDDVDTIKNELIGAVDKALKDNDEKAQS
jgi:bifunctional oligoribonuclease and PAP phosphatase NrnA